MRRPRRATPSDYRRLAQLVWKRGGVYDVARNQSWKTTHLVFGYRNTLVFHALGHRWTLSLCAGVFRKALEAAVALAPENLLSPREVERLKSLGFYDDMTALFARMGYSQAWIGSRGNADYVRYLRQVSEIAGVQRRFDDLDLGPVPRSTLPPQPPIDRLFEWGSARRNSPWSLTSLGLQVPLRERAAGQSWRTRRDVIIGLASSCSWLYVWPSPRFTAKHWASMEQSGFFKRTTAELKRLGQRGSWRADLFSDPDRMAAEFWKPQRFGPGVSWKDFRALLQWRLETS